MNKDAQWYQTARYVWRKLKMVRLMGALTRDSLYDNWRYWRWSHGIDADRTRTQTQHALLKGYHGVEKGLSLAEPRLNFGEGKIADLIEKMRPVADELGASEVKPALSSLHSYQEYNVAHGGKINSHLAKFLDGSPDSQEGGTDKVTRDYILKGAKSSGEAFFSTRHSVRNYGPDPVPMEDIRKAIDMARKTPSVCNRQGPRVYAFENGPETLKWQPGNRGFGHLASRALIVTADLQAFSGTGERNQPYVDGGMFAMSVLYALHALGYGACPLAWSMDKAKDKEMRRALDIPDNEAVIMFISVGTLPEALNVAKSYRLPVERYIIER